jgi:hypothetical protein
VKRGRNRTMKKPKPKYDRAAISQALAVAQNAQDEFWGAVRDLEIAIGGEDKEYSLDGLDALDLRDHDVDSIIALAEEER